MSRLAIGVGCRRLCAAEAILVLIARACEGLNTTGATLFTIESKRDEAGLLEAANRLHLPLMFLSIDLLRDALPRAISHSTRVEAAMGLSSVAEPAALVGAGAGSRLVVPRLAGGGATCAVAVPFVAGRS